MDNNLYVYVCFWESTELTGCHSTFSFGGPEKKVYTKLEDAYKLTLSRIGRRKIIEQSCTDPLTFVQVTEQISKYDSVVVFQTDHYIYTITKWILA